MINFQSSALMKGVLFFSKTDAALTVIFLLLVCYLFVCLGVLVNNRAKEASQTLIISNDRAKFELVHSYRHDSDFFRQFAERLQFSPHEPAVMQKCYETAILKGPADYRNFLSFARYLSFQNCCKDQLMQLIHESSQRAPNNPDVHLECGELLLRTHEKIAAMNYLKRASDLGAKFTEDVYLELAKNGLPVDALEQLTRRKPDSMLALATYLSKTPNVDEKLLRKAYAESGAMQLKPEQRVTLARLAYKKGDADFAERQAQVAARDSKSRLSALKLLSDIYSQQQNWDRYQQVMKIIQSEYELTGFKKKACEVAMMRLKISDRNELRKALEGVVAEYPNCGEALFRLGELSNSSPTEAREYMRKAVAADPAEFRYSDHLATLDIQLQKYEEAEEIYKRFLKSDSWSARAYIGLARCLESKGQRSEAIALLRDTISKSKKPEQMWKELGRLYSLSGAHTQAADAYSQYAQMTSDKPEGFLLAAEAYKNAGANENARKEYQAALKVDAANQRAVAGLKLLDSNE